MKEHFRQTLWGAPVGRMCQEEEEILKRLNMCATLEVILPIGLDYFSSF